MLSFPMCLLYVAVLGRPSAGLPVPGPFYGYVDFLKDCNEYKNLATITNLDITRFNPKEPRNLQTIAGNLTLRIDVDDTFWTHVVFDSRSTDGQRWIKNALIFKFPLKACSALREQIPDFSQVLFGDAFMKKRACVIKQGFYDVKSQPVNWTFPNVPMMPYGFYRVRLTAGKDKAQKNAKICWAWEAHAIPRLK